jgi:hypothetical protein
VLSCTAGKRSQSSFHSRSEIHAAARPPNFFRHLSVATGVQIMTARAVLCSLVLACVFSPANALTQEELVAKLKSAGYSQIRENGAGKIKTFKATKDGREVSVIVDSGGQIKELQ